MNNARLIILLVIVFIAGVSGIYWIYQSQVSNNMEELLPVPTPIAESEIAPTAEPSPPVTPSIAERNDSTPEVQPESGIGGSRPPDFPPLP